MGQINIKNIELNKDNNMNITSLKTTLEECLIKKIPVLALIAVIGSTQFSSVDDLCEILKLRNVFSKQGLYFNIHCDAALGGYFRSIIQVRSQLNPQSKHYVNSLSEHVAKQYVALSQADSITFDPHKSGYSVIGSGAIIYKNHKMTNFINFSSAYILNHDNELNMSIYGLQGSKSGALVASVYASIKSIPLDRLGHGSILEKCLMKTKIFYSKLQFFGQRYPQFTAITSSRTYTEKHNLTYDETQKRTQRNFLAQIASSTTKQINEKLSASKNYLDFQKYYRKSGPDLIIVCYGFNFFQQKYSAKVKNNSLQKFNMLNSALIKKCQPNLHMNSIEQRNMYLSRTIISYSKETLKVYHDFLNRAGLIDDLEENQKQIVLVRSTFYNPFYLKEDDDGRDIMDMTLERLKQNLKQTYQSLKKDPSFLSQQN